MSSRPAQARGRRRSVVSRKHPGFLGRPGRSVLVLDVRAAEGPRAYPEPVQAGQRTEIAASTVTWCQTAFDLDRAGLVNDERGPSSVGWSHAAIGGGEVARPMHADKVLTRFGQGHC